MINITNTQQTILKGIENQVIKAEATLSLVSGVPVIGTVAGACKIAMGTLQLVTALALAILSCTLAWIPTENNPARDLCKFSGRHVLHGAGNVLAGVLEALPAIQSILWASRFGKTMSNNWKEVKYDNLNGQEGMFMKYSKI